MPTLNWIGKQAVINHHQEVPFHLLKDVSELSCGDPGSGNLVVEGDNLIALKALLPYYAKQVKCIYIDPPYNTGVDERGADGKRTGWIYSDNVNSPEIRRWLNKVVGAEAEDLSRHDKWLCMMYPRIELLKKFMRDDGVIFASIDEVEYASLRLLLDEIFGIANRVGTIIWKNATDNNPTNIAIEHEYLLCYAKNRNRLPPEWKATTLAVKERLIEIGEQFARDYSSPEDRQNAYTKWFRKNKAFLWPFDRYKYIDEGGIYTGSQSVHNPGKEGYRYDVIHPITGKACEQPLMGYRFPEETLRQLVADDRVLFGEDETKIIELKVYVKDYRAKLSSLFELDGRIGTYEIKELFPNDKRPFDFPKPTELIEEIVSFTTSGDDLILDSFAGSGTTGDAILRLNKADACARRFILVEMKSEIAVNLTAERVRKVAEGYIDKKKERIEGTGGGFRFCRLGEPLFDETGKIRESVRFCDLARHVYFTETGEPLPNNRAKKSPLLGVTANGVAVYLLYNGVLEDRSVNGGNILMSKTLALLPQHVGPKIVYAAGSRLSHARLKKERITFKQTPYAIKIK
jgi:adenine-specific DNA-methyltransferase